MIHISEVLEGWLVREGMSAGSAATDDAREIDAGERIAHPAIGHRQGGGVTGPMGMGPEKDAGRIPRQFTGGDINLVAIATMKGARVVSLTPLMLIMDGGKA